MQPPDDNIVIKVADIFSPDTGFSGGKFILIKNGVITSIEKKLLSSSVRSVVDLSDFVASPLFCDYHLHFLRKAHENLKIAVNALLFAGIGRTFEGGSADLSAIESKDLLNEFIDIKFSGYAIFKKDGYGRFIGKGAENAHEAKRFIDQLVSLKVDYIKVINSGIYTPIDNTITPGGFEQDELIEIIDYAKDNGLDVWCHANGDEQIRHAVYAGASVIIHGLGISEDTIALMAQKNVFFMPTVNAFSALETLTDKKIARDNIRRRIDDHLVAVNKAFHGGVKLLPGSDSGPAFLPYGISYLNELASLQKAKISTEDILKSATIGSLKTGSPADFVLLKNLSVEKVFIKGKCLK